MSNQKGKRRLVLVSTMTYDPAIAGAEPPTGESLTVPDMALTIQQILERFSTGQNVKSFNPFYYDEEIPEFEQMDLAELQEYRTNLRSEISSLENVIQNKMDEHVITPTPLNNVQTQTEVEPQP